MEVLPEGAAGEGTLGVTVMPVEAAELGPLQPLAVTAIVAAPVKPAGKTIELLAPDPATADPFKVQL